MTYVKGYGAVECWLENQWIGLGGSVRLARTFWSTLGFYPERTGSLMRCIRSDAVPVADHRAHCEVDSDPSLEFPWARWRGIVRPLEGFDVRNRGSDQR